MPTEEWMNKVLSTGRADVVDVEDEEEPEEPEELDLTGVDEAAELEDEPSEEPVEEPEEEPEGEPEDDEDDQQEPEEPPETEAVQEEEFYLGRYKTREEAEKGWLEKEGMISRQGDELAQLRQQMAEMQGYLQGVQSQPSAPGEFEAWAEAQFESGNAWGGASEVLDASLQSGDPSYVDSYIEEWKQVDPFEAARFRTMVDNQIAEAQRQAAAQNGPAPLQEIVNQAWVDVAQTDDALKDPEVARVVGGILKNTPALRAAALSGDIELTRSAIAIARDGYKMQGARTGTTGTPRKVKSSDAQRLQQEKLDATVTTGDSAPDERRGSTPEVAPELQDMMQRIAAGEGGFPKLRE